MKSSVRRWIGRVPDLSDVLARFPVPAAVMAIFTLILIFIDNFGDNESLGRMMMGLIIAGYVGVMITVAREAADKSRLIPLQIIIAILLAAAFWFSEALRLNLPMAAGATLAVLGNAVLWKKARNDLHVWDFTHKIWTGAGFAVLGSAIFLTGIVAIHEALHSLFALNIEELMQRLLLPVGLGLLAPLYWLGTIPAVDESYDELYDNPGFVSKAVGFLGTWLLSPLTLIYALILLAYAVKIVMAGSLPKGEIAQLTTPFLLIGTLTWLVLEPPFIQKHALAKLFRKLWWSISIPATLMLAVAVWVRVQEYGFTEERVALVLVVLWTLGLALWFGFGPKEKRDIRIIPGFGSVLLIIGALGAGWLSVANQSTRLQNNLIEIKAAEEPTLKSRQQAKSAMQYLWHKNAEGTVRKAAQKAGYELNAGATLDAVFDAVDVKDVVMPSRHSIPGVMMTYVRQDHPINIRGYDQFVGPIHYVLSRDNAQPIQTIGPIEVLIAEGDLIFMEEKEEIGRFALRDWVMSLPVQDNSIIPKKSQHIVLDQGGRKAAIDLRRITLWTERADDNMKMNDKVEFNLLASGF